jgi:hypothetical protein
MRSVGMILGLALAAATGGCGASPESSAKTTIQETPKMIYLAPDPEVRLPKGIKAEQLERLNGAEIRKTLTDRFLGLVILALGEHTNSAPDTEEFKIDGTWSWFQNQRGPDVFFGRWQIRDDYFCVTTPHAEKPSMSCRYLWTDRRSGNVLLYSINEMDHKSPLRIRPIKQIKQQSDKG